MYAVCMQYGKKEYPVLRSKRRQATVLYTTLARGCVDFISSMLFHRSNHESMLRTASC